MYRMDIGGLLGILLFFGLIIFNVRTSARKKASGKGDGAHPGSGASGVPGAEGPRRHAGETLRDNGYGVRPDRTGAADRKDPAAGSIRQMPVRERGEESRTFRRPEAVFPAGGDNPFDFLFREESVPAEAEARPAGDAGSGSGTADYDNGFDSVENTVLRPDRQAPLSGNTPGNSLGNNLGNRLGNNLGNSPEESPKENPVRCGESAPEPDVKERIRKHPQDWVLFGEILRPKYKDF